MNNKFYIGIQTMLLQFYMKYHNSIAKTTLQLTVLIIVSEKVYNLFFLII